MKSGVIEPVLEAKTEELVVEMTATEAIERARRSFDLLGKPDSSRKISMDVTGFKELLSEIVHKLQTVEMNEKSRKSTTVLE